jgi:signal transduction histidine kinase
LSEALPPVAPVSRPRRLGWILYGVGGLLFGLYLGLNQIIGLLGHTEVAAWKPMTWELSSVVVIFGMIPLVALYERRVPVDSKPRLRAVAAHFVGAVLFSAVHVAGIVALRKFVYALAGESYEFGNLALKGFYEFQKDLITYLIVLVVIFAYREFQRRRSGELTATRLIADLSEAKLKHLTAQIEPHFLFNALNAISNRMHEDVDAADRMISDLGGLLRAAYDTDSQLLVPLAREIEWLRGYAAMMTERYRGQLTFELQVSPGLEQCQVPRLLLQPLVENALRHGLSSGRGNLRVRVDREDAALRYVVSDDGVGIAAGARHGTGLSNVTRRLELLFPGRHQLSLEPASPGTRVTLTFPAIA